MILPGSAAASSIPPAELERRSNSFNTRKKLLQTNPSLYVSKTRLSIRQIPTFVTERLLRHLAKHAVKTFKSEVKEGLRTNLSSDELIEPVVEEDQQDVPSRGKGKEKVSVPPRRLTGVKQAKVVRQQERVDPVTGKGKSKGYGFLEMHRHADALRVLRWSNNNPDVHALFATWWKEELADLCKQEEKKDGRDDARLRRMKEELETGSGKAGKNTLIVEFSIENVQVVQRRSAAQKDQVRFPTLPVSSVLTISLD